MASAPASTHSLLLLRRLTDLLPTHLIAQVRLAPSLALAAVLDKHNKLFLYYIGKEHEAPGFIPGFAVEDVQGFHWVVPHRQTIALIIESRGSIYIYHFIRTHFKTIRKLNVTTVPLSANNSSVSTRITALPSFSPKNTADNDADVYEYIIPFSAIGKGIESFSQLKKAFGP